MLEMLLLGFASGLCFGYMLGRLAVPRIVLPNLVPKASEEAIRLSLGIASSVQQTADALLQAARELESLKKRAEAGEDIWRHDTPPAA